MHDDSAGLRLIILMIRTDCETNHNHDYFQLRLIKSNQFIQHQHCAAQRAEGAFLIGHDATCRSPGW
eukprot:7222822-Prymnesium_polylepis.1